MASETQIHQSCAWRTGEQLLQEAAREGLEGRSLCGGAEGIISKPRGLEHSGLCPAPLHRSVTGDRLPVRSRYAQLQAC